MPPIAPIIPGTDALADAVRRWASHAIIDFLARYEDGQIVASEDLEDYPMPPGSGARWQSLGIVAIEGDTFYLLIPYGD